jgi:hypothetical protein
MFKRRLLHGEKLQKFCTEHGISLTPLTGELGNDGKIVEPALQQRYLNFLRERRDSRLWTIALAVTIASVVSATATFGASREAKKANRIAVLSAEAAKQSSDAAMASVRAWLSVADWVVPPPERINEGIGKLIENVGKTSALNPEMTEEYFFLPNKDSPIPPLTDCQDFPSSKRIAIGSVAGPSSPRSIPAREIARSFSNGQIISLSHHLGRVILHGCVMYKLVGSAEKVGVTEFCSVFYINRNSNMTETCGNGVRME